MPRGFPVPAAAIALAWHIGALTELKQTPIRATPNAMSPLEASFGTD
jgi:hypothetical protein